jgi:hypothetical protein
MTFGYYTLTTVLAAVSGLFWTSVIIIPNVKEMTLETVGSVMKVAPPLSSKTLLKLTMSDNVQEVIFGMVRTFPFVNPHLITHTPDALCVFARESMPRAST